MLGNDGGGPADVGRAQPAAEPAEIAVRIDAQPLAEALKVLAQQTGLQLLVDAAEIPPGARAPEISGQYSPREALERMLAKTGLKYEFIDARTVRIAAPNTVGSTATPRLRVVQAGNDTQTDASSKAADSAGRGSDGARADAGIETSIAEIVVTATKRTQNVQDTPMSVTALGTTEIERRGFVSMADYLRTIPGVSQIDGGVGRNSIVIRGVSAAPQTDSSRMGPTVGIYLSDIPLAGYSVNRDSVDLKRRIWSAWE